ncbi:hypothetical protein HanRHA438_Chr07g0323971 [Helianthus annuus]|nr:hypothetical protein HanRHA438_Chr07g0323971 [Helianthus annuus]
MDVRRQNSSGISPANMFDLRLTSFNFVSSPSINKGMLPVSLFSASSIISKLFEFKRNAGSFPERLLLRMLNDWIEDKVSADCGISPERLLFSKFMTDKACQFIQQSGITPDRLLLARSRNISGLSLSKRGHRNFSRDPER